MSTTSGLVKKLVNATCAVSLPSRPVHRQTGESPLGNATCTVRLLPGTGDFAEYGTVGYGA